MSRLRRISVENYRAFERGLDLDLRPLTLIYGKNNAGKSSVVRLAGILHDSVAEGSKSPFDLGGAAAGNASFVDVLNARARDDEGKSFVELTLGWDDDVEASWRIGLHESTGGSQNYCLCDNGLCAPPSTDPVSLSPGIYPETFTWQGKNWTGPSDTPTPMGAPFPPGDYTLRVSALGWRGTVDQDPFTVSATWVLHLVP
jgi:hypothetical protein